MVFCAIIIVMLNSKKRSHNILKPVQMEDNYQDVELSDEQQRVYNIMESTYDNMIITGKAGTISSLTSSEVEVEIGGRRYKVNQEIWEKVKYDYDRRHTCVCAIFRLARKSSNTWLVRKSNNNIKNKADTATLF